MYKVTGDEKLYLVEFRIHPEGSALRVYSLYVDGERAIYQKKRPILFFDPKLAAKALAISTCGAAKIKKIPKQVECVYDFHQAFLDLENPKKKTTRHGNLLECLIVLDDYCQDRMNIKEKWKAWMPSQPPSNEEPKYKIRLLPEWIPDEYDFYRKIFAAFDYFMFNTKIDPHFEEVGYGRTELVRAMKYLIGDIATNTIFIS